MKQPIAIASLGTVLLAFSASTLAQSPAELAVKAGCSGCHLVDKKLLGPSYHDIAAKYKGQADAPASLQARVRQGGKGVWGPVAMPPTDAKKVSDAEVKTLVAWVLKTP